MALACLIRLGILPLLFLGGAFLLSGPVELRRVMVLQAAMPSAVFPIIMARHYGGDSITAVRVVVVTTVLGLITIPLWIRAGMHWLAL
jgi:predicted permease